MVWIDSDYAATLTPTPSVTGGLGSGAGQNNPGYSAPTYTPPQTYGPVQPSRQYAPSADPNGQYYSDDGGATWLWEDFAPTGDADMGIGGSAAQMPGYGMGFQSNPPYAYQDPGLGYETTRADDVYPSADPGFEWRKPGGSGDDAWEMYYADPNYNPNWYQDAYWEWADQPMPQQNRVGRAGMWDQFATVGEAYNDWTRGEQARDYRGNTAMPTPMWGSGDPEVAQWQGNPEGRQLTPEGPTTGPFGLPSRLPRSKGGFFGNMGEDFNTAMYPFDYVAELGGSVTDAQIAGLNQARHGDIWGGTGTSLGGFSEAYGDLTNPNEAVGEFRDRPWYQQLGYGAVFDPTAVLGIGKVDEGIDLVRRAPDLIDAARPAMRGLGEYGSDVASGLGRAAPSPYSFEDIVRPVREEIDIPSIRGGSIDINHPHADTYFDTLAKYEIEYGFDDTGKVFLNDPEGAQLTADALLSRAAQDIIAVHTDASRAVGSFDGLGNRVVNGRTIEGGGGARATHTFGTGSPEAYAAMRDAERIFDVLDEVPTSPALEAARAPWPNEAVFPAVSNDEFRALERQWNQTIAAKKTTSVEGRAIAAELGIAEADRYIANVVTPEYGIRDTLHSISAEIDRVERYERNTVPLRKGERLQDGVRLSGGKLVDREYTLPIPKRAYVTRLREVLAEIDDKGLEGLHNVARAADTRPGQSLPSAVAPDEVRAAVSPAAGRSAATPSGEVTVKQPDLFGEVRDTGLTEAQINRPTQMDALPAAPRFQESGIQQSFDGSVQELPFGPTSRAPESIAVSNAPRPTPTFPLRGDRVTDAAGREGTVIRGSNTGAKAPITVRFEDGTTKRAARDTFSRVQPDVETMTLRELARELDLDPKMRQQLIIIEAKAARGAPEDQMLAEAAKRRLGEALAEERKTAPALSGPRAKPQATSKAPVEGPPLSVIDRPDAPPLTFADEAIIGGKPPPPGKFDSSIDPSSPHWRPTKGGLVRLLGEIVSLPRAFKSTIDISMPGRQGWVYAFSRPKQWTKAWGPQMQALASKKKSILLEHKRDALPNARIHRESGLFLPRIDEADVALREEATMSTWIGRIPAVGNSQRAATTYLNELRTGVFDAAWNSLDPMQRTAANAKDLATVINAATGRGGPLVEGALGNLVSQGLFSQRMLTSRFQLLAKAAGPGTTGPARKEALRALFGFTVGNVALLTALERSGVAEVEWDPRSSDFGKLRVGNARYDLGAGYLQLIRYGSQLYTGERKTASGRIVGQDRWETIGRFGRSKLSPTAGEIPNQLTGKNFIGEDIDNSPLGIATRLFAPLSPQDIEETRQEFGIEAALWTLPNIVGIGSQYYETSTDVRKRLAEAAGRDDWRKVDAVDKDWLRKNGYAKDLDGLEPEPGSEFAASKERATEIGIDRLKVQEQNDALFTAGKIDGDEWRERRNTFLTDARTRKDEIYRSIPEKDVQFRGVLDNYYAEIDKAVDPLTNKVDWDRVDSYMATLPQADRDRIEQASGLSAKTPLEEKYRAASKAIEVSGYFDLRDKLWSELNVTSPVPGYTEGMGYYEWKDLQKAEYAKVYKAANPGASDLEVRLESAERFDNVTDNPIIARFIQNFEGAGAKPGLYKERAFYPWTRAYPDEFIQAVEFGYIDNPDSETEPYLYQLLRSRQ